MPRSWRSFRTKNGNAKLKFWERMDCEGGFSKISGTIHPRESRKINYAYVLIFRQVFFSSRRRYALNNCVVPACARNAFTTKLKTYAYSSHHR
jgi:hypothetical protein